MKKWRRMRPLMELLAELDARDFDRREYALFQLGLILERSNHSDSLGSADVELPRELLRLNLSEREQEAVAEALSNMILRCSESRSTAFWALGKANPSLMPKHLLDLICEVGFQLEDEAAFQACDALGMCLAAGEWRAAFGSANPSMTKLMEVLSRWRLRGGARLRKSAADALSDLGDDAL